MTRLLIANEFNEDRSGIAEARLRKTAWWTMRLLWFARDDDVLLLAVAPDEEFLAYVTGLTGTRRSSLRIVVPPPGSLGAGVLSPDRMLDPRCQDALRDALDGREVSRVVPLHPDASVAELAARLGLLGSLPGHGFLGQGGGRLVNSKAAFRAVAAGTGTPLPEGGVCTERADAETAVWRLLGAGLPVILKHDLRAGGRGNEILSPVEGTVPVGAQRSVVVTDRASLRDYFALRWDWLTSRGQSPVVVERYVPGSAAVFAEFDITDEGPRFAGQGELVSAPLAAAEIIPAPCLTPDTLARLTDGGHRLSAALHAMGYRGTVSADAVLTPDGEILFTEYNGRITGSTPVYAVIGDRLAGGAPARTLLDRDGWEVPSFRAALDRLTAAGLAFDPGTRTGTVLVMPYNTGNGSIRYCVVEDGIDKALERGRAVEELFAPAAR